MSTFTQHCNENGHTSNTCPQLNEHRRASRRVAALEPSRIEQLREAHRIQQLNEDQIRRQNERHRIGNLRVCLTDAGNGWIAPFQRKWPIQRKTVKRSSPGFGFHWMFVKHLRFSFPLEPVFQWNSSQSFLLWEASLEWIYLSLFQKPKKKCTSQTRHCERRKEFGKLLILPRQTNSSSTFQIYYLFY